MSAGRANGLLGVRAGDAGRPDARVLEPFASRVDETLARYPARWPHAFMTCCASGATRAASNGFCRYVREARPRPKTEVFLRLQTLPGEQALLDWARLLDKYPRAAAPERSGSSYSCWPTRAPASRS